jgi:hypothetical protein
MIDSISETTTQMSDGEDELQYLERQFNAYVY